MDLELYYKEKFARNHYKSFMIVDALNFISEFEGLTDRQSNVICFNLDKINFMNIIFSRDKFKYFADRKDLLNCKLYTKKLTPLENREKSEFNLFREIILKKCNLNNSWLSNNLIKANEINRS